MRASLGVMRTFLIASVSIVLVACSSGGGSGSGGGANAGGANAGGANAGGANAGGGGGSATGGSNTGGATATGGGGGAAPHDTWNNYAKNFFSTYCVSCHNPNDPARDYNKLADVMSDAPTIRCGVAPMQESGCGANPTPKQFPVGTGAKPSDADRARIVAWIDAGLP